MTDLTKIINKLADSLGGLPGILAVILGVVGRFQADKITGWLMKGQTTIGSIVASVTGESEKIRAQALGGIDKNATTSTTLNGQDYSDSQIGEMFGHKILEAERQAQA